MLDELRLDEQERGTTVWQKIERHLQARLTSLRTKNDNDVTDEQTSKLRGRIAEVKELLLIGARPQPIPDDSDRFKD